MTNSPLPLLQTSQRRTARRSWRWPLLVGGLFAVLVVASLAQPFFSPAPIAPPFAPIPAARPEPVVAGVPNEEQSVVAIEHRGPRAAEGDSVGSGFFVADSQLIATSLHVAAQCTEANVRLADGTTYEVSGYVAIDRAHDLALLALRDPPPLKGFSLASHPGARRSTVQAIGHPRGVEFVTTRGELGRAVTTSDLPEKAQKFVRELAPGLENAIWIRHTAYLAPGSSDGPLLNARGELLGINAWVDQQAGFSFAVPVEHLRPLLASAKTDSPQPLASEATPAARAATELWRLSANRLRKLLDSARAMRWQPQTADEYRELQQLAWGITVARLPDALSARGTLGDRLEELSRAADEVETVLRKERWQQLAQVTMVNEYAELQMRNTSAGLFFFATVDRVVEAEQGGRALIVTLAGFNVQVFVPLETQLVVPEPGSQCLVLGVNDRGRSVQWGENPRAQQSAPVVTPGLVLKLGN